MATDYVVRFTGQDNLSGTIDGVKQKLQEVGSATSNIDQLSQKFHKIEQSTAPLKRKLRDLKTLMAQMNLDGLSNTDLFNQMAQQAGTYADAISDAATATNVFANDNFKLEAMAQGLQGVAGAASVATGVMGLLGTENEDLAKAIMKVQSVLAVLNGVQAIANVLNKDSALMLRLKQIRQVASTTATASDTVATTVNTTATSANTAATVVNTTAQKAWNVAKAVAKALLGDWTGLVLVGAVALGAYALATSDSKDELEKEAKAIDKVKEAQNKFNSDLASSTGQLIGKYKLLQNEWKNLKNTAEKTQWLKDNQTEFKNLGIKVGDLKAAEDVFVNNTQNVVTALKARASAMAAQSMLTEAYTEYYKRIMEADNTVAGGGYYHKYSGRGSGWTANNPNITDEMRAAGVTVADFNQRTTTKRSGSTVYDTTEYQESQTVIDKVNAYRIRKANETNRAVKQQAEADLNKTVDFATAKINEANAVIEANGLNFSPSTVTEPSGTNTPSANRPTAPSYESGSLADLEAQYKRLEDELKNTNVSPERLQMILQEKEALQQQIKELKIRNGLLEPEAIPSPEQLKRNAYREAKGQISQVEEDLKMGVILDVATAEAQIADINKRLEELGLTPIPVKLTPTIIEQKRTAYQNAEQQVQQIHADYKLKIIDKDEAKAQLEAINAELTALGLKPIELYVNAEGLQTAAEAVETFHKNMESVSSAVGSFGSAFSSLSEAIGGTGGAMLEMAGQTMQAVAQIIPQVVALIGAKEGEALASGTASASGLPFPANLAAIASIIATITALFASFAGKFADGGVISGGSFHGDKLLARVNAGEMILNQKQQGTLFKALDGGFGKAASGKVEFEIAGSKLKGVLRNYDNKLSKIK